MAARFGPHGADDSRLLLRTRADDEFRDTNHPGPEAVCAASRFS
jgi:hypothetical protein